MDGDLINRAEALKAIEKLYADWKFWVYNDSGEIFAKCHNAISNVPAVDTEPVRHGRWIQAKTAPSYHYCSYCKSTYKMTMSCNKYVLLKYCPNCGARMDGEEE